MPTDAALPSVSVVVPTIDRPHNLEAIVTALCDDPVVAEIIIVVDGADPATTGEAERLSRSYTVLTTTALASRAGPNGARAAGVELAQGDVVLLLDDDVIPQPRLASGHAELHLHTPGAVVVGYMPVTVASRLRPHHGVSLLYAREYELSCRRYEDYPDSILTNLWGGNVSLRRDDCRRVGVASARFPLRFHEDSEFGIRCAAAGLRGVFSRMLRASHRHEKSLEQFLTAARESGEARVLLRHVHPNVDLGSLDPSFLAQPKVSPRAATLARRLLTPLAHTSVTANIVVARTLRKLEQRVGAQASPIDAP